MKDYLIRAIDKSGKIRIFATTTTNLVEKARNYHNTSVTATAALGRLLTAGIMMAQDLKNNNDVITVSIEGNGPAKGLHVVARPNGTVKGYVIDPSKEVDNKYPGKLDVGALIGNEGLVTVIKDLGLKEPYIGKSKLVTGEIAEDIANYYAISEQKPSAVSLGVLIDTDRSVRAAGGYIIELLPGVTEEEIQVLEDNLKNAQAVSTMIDKKMSPEEIIEDVLSGFEIEILEKKYIKYECDCSREKIERALISLGEKEIKDIIEEDGEAELVCHFCDNKYHFDMDDLEKILLTIKNK